MATTQQQEHPSPPPETVRPSSDEPQATMGTAGGVGAGEVDLGAASNAQSPPSPWAALLSMVSSDSSNVVSLSSLVASTQFRRKRRSDVARTAAAPSRSWDMKKLGPVLPPTLAKKTKKKKKKAKNKACVLCEASKTPRWRSWPTDGRVALCNACGIRVRALGVAARPELLYLPHPPATTGVVVSESDLEHPVAPPHPREIPKQVRVHLPPLPADVPDLEHPPAAAADEIQPASDSESPSSPPDSPILHSMLDVDAPIYLLKRTSPRRDTAAAPRWCLHCGSTSTRQWRTGPAGEGTLCNPCGLRYMQERLVPEYRPRASPTFDPAKHSNKHTELKQIRGKLAHAAPPPPYLPVRPRRKRRNADAPPPQEQNLQPAQAAHKGKRKRQHGLPPEPALLRKDKKQHRRQPPLPAAATQQRDGNGMLQNPLFFPPPPPPPPPVLLHAGGAEMVPLPPALPRAGDDAVETEQRRLLFLPLVLLQQAGDEMEQHQHQQLPPPPPTEQPHAFADGELMIGGGDDLPLPDSFLFDGPAAPMIIDDDEPAEVEVIVIPDDD